MSISLTTEAGRAGSFPAKRHSKRERKLLQTAKANSAYACVAAANYTTAGGAAAEAITVSGVLATDTVMATIKTTGATPRTIVKAACTSNTVTITFSGDPSTDHVVAYHVMRALS